MYRREFFFCPALGGHVVFSLEVRFLDEAAALPAMKHSWNIPCKYWVMATAQLLPLRCFLSSFGVGLKI